MEDAGAGGAGGPTHGALAAVAGDEGAASAGGGGAADADVWQGGFNQSFYLDDEPEVPYGEWRSEADGGQGLDSAHRQDLNDLTMQAQRAPLQQQGQPSQPLEQWQGGEIARMLGPPQVPLPAATQAVAASPAAPADATGVSARPDPAPVPDAQAFSAPALAAPPDKTGVWHESKQDFAQVSRAAAAQGRCGSGGGRRRGRAGAVLQATQL